MKKPDKKKKKKGSRKKNRSESGPKLISTPAIGPKETEKEPRERTYKPIAKRESEKKIEKKGIILKYLEVTGRFLQESRMELKKVKWPTRKELLASTAMVIVLVLIVAFFLGLIDLGLIKLIKHLVG